MSRNKIINDIVVLGLGNPLMADEGIGGFLINKLLEKKDSYPDIDFVDAGTGGMAIMHLIAERNRGMSRNNRKRTEILKTLRILWISIMTVMLLLNL